MILRHRTVATVPRSPGAAASQRALSGTTLSDSAGVSQFGVHIVELHPGAQSSDRHWHEREDEFLLVLAGQATVVENDGPHRLGSGDAACWPAGVADGHHERNLSDQPCLYLIVGWRTPDDLVDYSDIDRVYTCAADGQASRTRQDGTPLR